MKRVSKSKSKKELVASKESSTVRFKVEGTDGKLYYVYSKTMFGARTMLANLKFPYKSITIDDGDWETDLIDWRSVPGA